MSMPRCNLGFLSPTATICGGNVGEGLVLCVRGSGMRVSVPFSDLTGTHIRQWAEHLVVLKVWLTHL